MENSEKRLLSDRSLSPVIIDGSQRSNMHLSARNAMGDKNPSTDSFPRGKAGSIAAKKEEKDEGPELVTQIIEDRYLDLGKLQDYLERTFKGQYKIQVRAMRKRNMA
jgi:hypothetical protein